MSNDVLPAVPAAPPTLPAVLEPQPVRVIAAPHPFSTQRVTLTVDEGATLLDIVRLLRLPDGAGARVFIERDDKIYGPIPRAQWARIKPRRDSRVTVRATAGQSGGGGDSNKTTRTILQAVIILIAIVIIVVSYGTASAAAFPLIAAAVSVGAGLSFAAINMLLPPQTPKLGSLAAINGASRGEPTSPTLSISGSRNQANRYGVIPKLYGRHRLFPPSAR